MAKANPKGERPSRRRHEAESEEVHPKLGGRTAKVKPPPKLDDSPQFFFTHHHERWIVMGGQVIPGLGKLKLRPGVNGVDEHPKTGEVIAQHVIDTAKENGLVVIPHDVDGEGTTYLRRPKGTNAVISRFERVYSGSNQVDCDEPAYVAWCLSLVERGIIAPAPAYVLERMRARLAREVEDLADVKGQARYRARLEADLEAVERVLADTAPEAELEEVTPTVAAPAPVQDEEEDEAPPPARPPRPPKESKTGRKLGNRKPPPPEPEGGQS